MVCPTSGDGVAIGQGMVGRNCGQVNRSTWHTKTAIAASRIPPWLPSGWGCRSRRLKGDTLLRQPHPAQQVGVAGVGTKWHYDGVDSDTFQGVVPFVVRPFEPRKTTVSLASREVDVGNHRGRYVCRSLNL